MSSHHFPNSDNLQLFADNVINIKLSNKLILGSPGGPGDPGGNPSKSVGQQNEGFCVRVGSMLH